MKRIFIAVACISFFAACHNGNNTPNNSSGFELSGKFSGGGAGVALFLERMDAENNAHLDSTKINGDGTFAFHTKGIVKGFYRLRITESDFAILILDSNEKVHITGDAQFLGNTYTTTGSPDTKLFLDLNQYSRINYGKRDSLQRFFQALMNIAGGNKKKVDSLSTAVEGPYDTLVERQVRYVLGFLKANPASFASLAAVEQLTPDKYISYYTSLDSSLSKAYPTSSYVKIFSEKVDALKRVAIGAVAPELSLPDTNGTIFNLSNLRGKVVLIDFWASWCGPCREALPNVVKVYDKFKDKNFTVLSVSLDKDKDAWLAAIHKFHLHWTNISDLKYWDSKAVTLYNFKEMGIPFTVLVSADGKIVDTNISEDDLENEVANLVGSKKM